MNIDVPGFFNLHPMGENATHPIARFSARLALLLLLAGECHAASSPLQGASAPACADRSTGGQHAARIPCGTLASQSEKRTLGRVQLPFLGLLLSFYSIP